MFRKRKIIAGLASIAMLFNTAAMQVFAEEDTQTNNMMVEEQTDVAVPYATSMYLGHFQFTGYNTGSWRSVPGTHVRVCIAIKAVDGLGSYDFDFGLEQYPNVPIGTMRFVQGVSEPLKPDSDGYYFIQTPYYTINPNSDCRLWYMAISSGFYELRKMDVHVWYDYY